MKSSYWATALLGALACTGAADGDATSLGATSAPIIDGTYNTGDPAVALVYLQDAAGDVMALCSATLISPTILLTAAHCVHPSSGASRWTAYFGTRTSGDPLTIATISVVDYAYHPDWRASDLAGGHDVALLKLAEPPPAAQVTPVPINRKSMDGREGMPVRLVGWGNFSGAGEGSGAGTKREGTATLEDAQSFVLYYTPSPNNTCQGDSGGPTFATIDGVEVVAGITSFGPQGCGAYGASTRVDSYLTFIDDFIAQKEGPSCAADGACLPTCPGQDPDCPTLGTGAPCNVADNCSSQICLTAPDDGMIKFCTALCDPAAAAACPEGMRCVPAGADADVCIFDGPTPGALGGACAEQNDCSTGLCIGLNGDMVCSKFCSEASECGASFDCEAAGGAKVCVPKPASTGDDGDGGGGGCAAGGGGGGGGARGAADAALVLAALLALGYRLTTSGRARTAGWRPGRRRR